jgi:protein-S-isoprenylcysteine O-methyltransferase Ste14
MFSLAVDKIYGSQTITLAASFFLAGYLSYRSLTPPASPPERPYHQDTAGVRLTPSMTNVRRGLVVALWLYQISLALTYSTHRGLFCPVPENLAESIFSWSLYTIVCLSLIFVSASIRLLAFAELGSNFTFQLGRPSKLVRTGLYAHVQHPSYTGHFVVSLANIALLLRPRGMFGCWMPSTIIGWADAIFAVFFILFALLFTLGLRTRVKEEEYMLKLEFGEEWEVYHAETKRFIPRLF